MKSLPADQQAAFAKTVADLLEKQGVGLDLGAYRDAPPGLAHLVRRDRGSIADVAALMQWVGWAYAEAKAGIAKAA